jgi:DNA-binding transcriptional MerR regulator
MDFLKLAEQLQSIQARMISEFDEEKKSNPEAINAMELQERLRILTQKLEVLKPKINELEGIKQEILGTIRKLKPNSLEKVSLILPEIKKHSLEFEKNVQNAQAFSM